ncbi:ephrin type-B receptor 1-like [Gigantopelta aegis]|uniref:ephrin type-B receptor 1-like n=1 Tax=Gigantopelta aegis TaxID=1735272 RepID=UPI001B88DADD|nr:ephrin type-B receptor 1-like [Gigantopelta aegis]
MELLLSVHVLVLVILSSAWGKEEDVILDSTTFGNLNWDSFMATSKQTGWQEDLHKQNRKLISFYSICDVNRKGANSWVTTPGVPTNGSAHLWLELQYTIKPCSDVVPVCQLGVYYHELERPSVVPVPLHAPWKELLTLTNNVTVTDTKATLVINEISTIISLKTKKPYLSVGFQDNGSCTKLMSVRIFTRFCSNTTKAFATFRQTFALLDDQVIIGQCVPNSELAFDPKSTCTRDGDWERTTGGCKCRDGYTAVEDTECISTSKCSQVKSGTSLLLLVLVLMTYTRAIW